MKIKLLHLGLPKCGSTYLQKEIFPEISKKTNIELIDTNKVLNHKEKIFHDLENEHNLEKRLPESFIISNEEWFSKKWEFSRIEKSFQYIKKNFSKDTIIFFVVRNPYDLLNSIYAQSIHEMEINKPEEFFYLEKNEFIRKNRKFNLYNFNYDFLISLYKSYFDRVIITRYENFKEFSYLEQIFSLDNRFLDFLKKKKNRLVNKSISKNAVKTILFLDRFLNVKKTQNFLENCINNPTDNLLLKVRNNFFRQLLLVRFFQKKFDRFMPYKKFQIDKRLFPINIDKLIEDYYSKKF